MRIVFAGTPDFSVPCLNALHASRHEVVGVYTQPDRPAGRGRVLSPSAIKRVALDMNLPLCQPHSLKTKEALDELASFAPDVMVVIAYGLILPKAVLSIPRLGCINVHASLLPRWRGAAPIQRAILAGDTHTGVSIMQMDEGLDTGDVLGLAKCDIAQATTSQNLHQTLSLMGPELLLTVLDDIEAGKAQTSPQNNALATYAQKINKSEGAVDWQQSADSISRQVRAFTPWPAAFAQLADHVIKLHRVSVIDNPAKERAGVIVDASSSGIVVACGEGQLCIERLQWPGARAMESAELLNAKAQWFKPGIQFE